MINPANSAFSAVKTKPPLIVIVGPTAVGKTEIAIQLAERLNGEIVSADSRIFYRGMDIGTAKPALAERARVPHHLIDVADPDETWSLAMFQKAAAEAIADIHKRGKLPFLAGGTGQYVRALTQGWSPPPQPPNARLRLALEMLAQQKGYIWLHEILKLLDPPGAEIIDPRNVRRTVRALEVIFGTGRRFSEQYRQGEPPYRLLTLGLNRPRPELYAQIDARIEAMFAAGFLEEVKELLARGYSPDLPSMSAIGYREGVSVVQGKMTREQAIVQMKRLTRVFVRRQGNWFRQEAPAIRWFDMQQHVVDEIEAYIHASL